MGSRRAPEESGGAPSAADAATPTRLLLFEGLLAVCASLPGARPLELPTRPPPATERSAPLPDAIAGPPLVGTLVVLMLLMLLLC